MHFKFGEVELIFELTEEEAVNAKTHFPSSRDVEVVAEEILEEFKSRISKTTYKERLTMVIDEDFSRIIIYIIPVLPESIREMILEADSTIVKVINKKIKNYTT